MLFGAASYFRRESWRILTAWRRYRPAFGCPQTRVDVLLHSRQESRSDCGESSSRDIPSQIPERTDIAISFVFKAVNRCSNSRGRCRSACRATVLERTCLIPGIRSPAKVNSYHQYLAFFFNDMLVRKSSSAIDCFGPHGCIGALTAGRQVGQPPLDVVETISHQ